MATSSAPLERETSLELFKPGNKIDVVRSLDPGIRCTQNVARDYKNCRSRSAKLGTYAGVAVEQLEIRMDWHEYLDRITYRFAPGTKEAAFASVPRLLGPPTASDETSMTWRDAADYTKLAVDPGGAPSLTMGNTISDENYRNLRIASPADPATLPKD